MNKTSVKLGEHSFVTKLAGFEHSKYFQYNATHRVSDIPLIQGKNIRNGKVSDSFDWYISKQISNALPRSVLNKRCIVIPYVGSKLGELAIFDKKFTCHLASNVAKVELIDDLIDLDFLYYYLRSSYGQSQLFIDKQGSAQPNITMEAIRNTKVIVFNKDYQQKIASVLSTIDSKIEINNKINAELESMAKTLYYYWFVQFDFPDENGKPYKSSGGKMMRSEESKRVIPEGWEVKKISELLPVLTGKQDANFANKNGEYNFFTCGEEILKCDSFEFEGKSILIAGNGNFNIKLYEGKFNAYQRTYVLMPKNEKYYTLIYMAVRDRIDSFTKGSRGSIVKFITKGDIEDIQIPLPKDESLDLFSSLNTITQKIEKNLEENQKLTQIRDWLLPMLMNGQVVVN